MDTSDTHTVSVAAPPGALGSLTASVTDPATGDGQGTVGWTYTLNNAAAQSLGEGETRTEVFVVTIKDYDGKSVSQNVRITITGDNDQVQITSGVQSGDAEEDSGDYGASGTITFTDVDLIDTHGVTVTAGGSGYLGSFTTDPLSDSTGTGSGSLGWNFSVANADLQYLGEAESICQAVGNIASVFAEKFPVRAGDQDELINLVVEGGG